MARSHGQVIRYVRGLLAVVVVSSVALSSSAVQAQTADIPVGSSAPQPSLIQPGALPPSRRAPVVLLPMFSESGGRPGPAYQPSRRNSQGSRSNKVLAGIGGAMLGGLLGVAVGSAMDRSKGADRGMAGGMIGFYVGAAVGAVVCVKLAR